MNSFGTVKEFLDRNSISILGPIFYFKLTLKGLGYYDEVAALYGFIAVPATLMDALRRSVMNGTLVPDASKWISIFIEKFQNFDIQIIFPQLSQHN